MSKLEQLLALNIQANLLCSHQLSDIHHLLMATGADKAVQGDELVKKFLITGAESELMYSDMREILFKGLKKLKKEGENNGKR